MLTAATVERLRSLLWLFSTFASAPVPVPGGHARPRRPDLRAGELADAACRCSRRSPSACSPRCSAARLGGVVGHPRRLERLRRPAAGARRERGAASAQLADAQIELQEQRALADRSARPRAAARAARAACTLKTTAAEIIGAGATPDFRTVTIDKGTQRRPARRHGGDRAGRRRRPGRRAERARRRRCSCSIDRNAAAGALIERSRAQGVVVGAGDERAADGVRLRGRRRRRRRRRRHLGHRRHLSRRGSSSAASRRSRRAAAPIERILVRPAVDFSSARRSAGRADADAGREARRGEPRVKAAGVVLATALGARAADHAGAVRRAGHRRRSIWCWSWSSTSALTSGPVDRAADRDVRRAGAGRAVERRHRHRRAGEDDRRVPGRRHRHAVHRRAAAAAVRGVFRRDGRCTRPCSSGCTSCWACGTSGRRMPAVARAGARQRGRRAWWRSSWSSCCRERSSAGAADARPDPR